MLATVLFLISSVLGAQIPFSLTGKQTSCSHMNKYQCLRPENEKLNCVWKHGENERCLQLSEETFDECQKPGKYPACTFHDQDNEGVMPEELDVLLFTIPEEFPTYMGSMDINAYRYGSMIPKLQSDHQPIFKNNCTAFNGNQTSLVSILTFYSIATFQPVDYCVNNQCCQNDLIDEPHCHPGNGSYYMGTGISKRLNGFVYSLPSASYQQWGFWDGGSSGEYWNRAGDGYFNVLPLRELCEHGFWSDKKYLNNQLKARELVRHLITSKERYKDPACTGLNKFHSCPKFPRPPRP